MNIKNIITSVIVSVLVALGALAAYHPQATTIVKEVPKVLGGSPDLSNSPVLTVGGINEWYVNVPMQTGTSTVCSIPNPLVSYAGASSTANTASTSIVYVSAHWTTPTTTAIAYDIATSTDPTATTSNLVTQFTVPANATSTAMGWIPTTFTNAILGSKEYITVKGNKVTNTTLGFCQAEFTQY